jgi:CelD/BcsL family acetyltransferase involved in cellulose biosynthesis
MLEVHVLDRARDLAALEPAWSALWKKRPELVLSPTWVRSWWRVYGATGGRKMRFVEVRDSRELVGLWPLLSRVALEKGAVPFRRLEMTGSGERQEDEVCSDYLEPLVDPARSQEVIRAMAEAVAGGRLGAFDDLVVPDMPAGSPAVRELAEALAAHGCDVSLEPCGHCPFVALPSSWDAYLAGLDGDRRYFVKRSLRDFEAWAGKGGFELRRVERETELDPAVRTLVALHEGRWSQGGVFQSPLFSAFHRHVMRELMRGAEGRLDLLLLRAKGEDIAAVYNLVVGGKTYFYQSGRRTDLPGKVRPGIVIHALAMQRAIAEGQREYDFMKGDSQYKQKLATGAHDLVRLRAVAPTLTARAKVALLRGATAVAREVRRRRAQAAPPAEAPAAAPVRADG